MKKFNLLALIVILFLGLFACDEVSDDFSGEKSGGEYYSTADLSYSGEGAISGGGNGDSTQITIEAGQITAGEWNDLDNWDFWLDLGQNEDYKDMPDHWDYNVGNRISVRLVNAEELPIINEKVQLLNVDDEIIWEALTDNQGMAELWPLLNGSSESEVRVKTGASIIEDVKRYAEGVNTIKLHDFSAAQPGSKIDIAFVVDATGSMADELEYLKVELVDVIDSVQETNGNAIINTASVFYRDEGDEYLTRESPFTTDVNTTINFIKDQSAGGGGDFPEAVHTALNKAINNLQWSANARSKILFLLLDAPPHHEEQIIDEINDLVSEASADGIKIVPITASGIDKETEFLMRYMAIASNGTYVFITNHSGIGGEHLEPTVGQYEVEYLNHLMVRLINQYLK